MAHLILFRRGDSSFGCNSVLMGHSVFAMMWSGKVLTMTDVEEATLLTSIMARAMKKRKEESIGIELLFPQYNRDS